MNKIVIEDKEYDKVKLKDLKQNIDNLTNEKIERI